MENSEKPVSKHVSLDDSIQLAIRDEVEKRVEQRENIYWKFGGLFVVVVALFFTFLWKVSVSEIRETVEKQLAEKEVVKARDRIMEIKSSAETVNQNLNVAAVIASNVLNSIIEDRQAFTNRLNEIKQQDNIILVNDLSQFFVSQVVTNLVDGRKIVLNFEPVPETVKLIPFAYTGSYAYSLSRFGYLDGSTIALTNNSDGYYQGLSNPDNLKSKIIRVEYMRKSLR